MTGSDGPNHRLGWVMASLGEGVLVGIVFFLLVGSSLYGLWQRADQAALQSKRSELVRLATALAATVDGDLYDTFRNDSQTNTKEFWQAASPLRKTLEATPGVKFIYTVRLDGDKVRLVIDPTDSADRDGDHVEDQSRVGEVYNSDDPALAEALKSKKKALATASPQPFKDSSGALISGFAPYFRKDGKRAGILGVDVDADGFLAEQGERKDLAVSGLLAIGSLSLVLLIVVFRARLAARRSKSTSMLDLVRNRRLAEIARRTANAVIFFDTEQKVEWVNEGFVRMTGFSASEVIGLGHSELLYGPDTDPAEAEKVAKAINDVRHVEGVLLKYRKDGGKVVVKYELDPVYDDAGGHAGYMALETDITDESRLQLDIMQSRQRLDAVFRSMAEGIVLTDGAGQISTVNPAAQSLLGLTESELVGKRTQDVDWPLTDKDGRLLAPGLDPVSECLRNGSPGYQVLYGVHRPDHKIVWLRVNTELVRGPEGTVQGSVASFEDVTESETAEHNLAEEQVRLHEFVSHAPAAIAMLNRDLAYVGASERWEELMGIRPGTSWGADHFELCPDSPHSWRSAFAECLQGHVVRSEEELWQPRGRDTTLHLSWEARPWRQGDGQVGGILVSAVDTTCQVEREGAIRAQTAELLDMNQKLDLLATRDPLTNLHNRRRFLEIVGTTLASASAAQQPAILYLDLDNFKYVNDAMGHDAGDFLLTTVSDRLLDVCQGGVVARLGGDEFAILLESTDEVSACKLAGSVVDRIKVPIEVDGRSISTSFSVGVALSRGRTSLEKLLQQADMAMYHAKSEGKNCWRVYEDWMADESLARLQLEADMRQAWDHRQFEVYYQPIVQVSSGNTVCSEALVRWKSSRRGVVGPDVFIPLLEEIGLIEQVGAWVLEVACRQTQQLRKAGFPNLRVAVNISGNQLKNPTFLSTVERALQETQLPPHALTVEVTETVLIGHLEVCRAKLEAIRAMGVKVAVDDFGTGYSSMGTLANLPIDLVKIDKAFVHSVGDSLDAGAIIRALITLSKVVELEVVAEGVETESQFVQLHALGTDYCQGYYFSGPLEAHKFEKWLGAGERRAA